MKTQCFALRHLVVRLAAVLHLAPLTAWATPAYNWDLQTYYPHAEPLPASLSSQQLASITQFDGFYPTSMIVPNGTGLTTAEMDEVAAMPGYFSLSRDPVTGVLSGRDIIMDGDDDAVAQPDPSKPASFYADFIVKVERLTDLYAKATSAQAPQLEQVYSDLIEHFLDLSYLPGGRVPGHLPLGNGYSWRDHGWKTLRMMNKLSAGKRDLYALSLAHVSGFSTLLPENSWSSTDIYYNYYPTANKALAQMSNTPAKWQLMRLVRRGMDVSTIGWESDPVSPLTPRDGSIIHHEGHSYNYGHYSYAGQLVMHTNWTTAGFSSSYTAQAIVNMRRASLAWCFTSTGGLMPYHQKMEGSLLSGTSLGDGGVGNGPDFALKAANLTSAYYGTPIADDLEMAYAAISKTGVGSTSLPTQWRTITPPANIASTSPLYTATLQGHYSRTTNGTSIQRGPGNWYASVRGQPSHWDGGEARAAMGLPDHFGRKAMHGSLQLITTGKSGRKPNEVDSGYRYEGWNHNYYPNVTCPDYASGDLLWWRTWAYFPAESNLMGSANLRDSGVWMYQGSACKSAFFLGNRIVLVTNNVTGNGLHTGLIQTAHDSPAAEPLVLDGSSATGDGTWTLAAGGNHKIVDPQGNAYFVHADAATPQIQARRGNQDWTYALPSKWTGTGTAPSFIYASDFLARMNEFTPTTANYSRVWFDHGATAANQALAYTVLVKPQAGELDSYATAMGNPATAPVTVTKSPRMHRYQDRATGTNALAVFDPSEAIQMGGLVTVNRPGAYIWRSEGDLLRLSVSSSDTGNTAAFQLSFTGEWTLDSQQDTYAVTVTPNAGSTAVSLSYRDTPQGLVLRRVLPEVSVSAPANNATLNAPVSQVVSASVISHGHGIAKVQFYDSTSLIGEDSTAPYAVTWTTATLGSHNLSARVVGTEGFLVDSAAVVVTAVNTAPAFTVNPIQARALVNTAFNGQLVATDPSSTETLTYTKVSGPAWLSVAPNGVLSGTPTSGNLGANSFSVRVTDSYNSQVTATLSITVASTNAAPSFTANPLARPAATEDAAYTASLAGAASDPDAGEWLSYSKVSGPAWLSVAANGALGGTPANGDVGANAFIVQVTDGAGASAQATLNLSVTNVNNAPVWTSSTLTKADAVTGSSYSASVFADASDADAGDTLTFSKVVGPAWLSVGANGALSGIPSSSTDSGPNLFTLRVMDAAGASADLTLGINVTVVYSNGTWVNAAGGTWGQAANWNAGAIAEGPGYIADFSTLNLLANATVTLDSPRSIGQLKFGDTTASHDWTLTGSSLVLSATSGTPSITVNNRTLTLGLVLAGTQGFTKTGAGALTLSGANTYAGITTVNSGSGLVTVNGDQSAVTGGWLIGADASAATTVAFAAGSLIDVAPGKQIRIGNTGPTGTGSQILNVAGEVVNAGTLLVGRPATLNLNAGGTWDQSGTMSVAAQGGYSAFFNVKSGSVFTYYGASTVKLNGTSGGAAAVLTIDGTFATSAGFEQTTATTPSTGRVTLQNGGTLKLVADVSALSTNVQFILGTGGGAIDTNGYSTTLAAGISGTTLGKRGIGTLTLAGSNSYTGATAVEGGALAVTGSLGNGAVTVSNNATLGGSGMIGGAVSVQAGGSLAPDGTLTINNALTLAGSALMDLAKNGTTLSSDKVNGLSSVIYGGSLVVTHLGPDLLAAGDSFQLFAATNYSGSFSNISLPALANGLVWNTTQLATNGMIRVRALPLAISDTSSLAEDTAATIAVLANDSDADGDLLVIDSVTQGAHGAVAITGDQVTYMPAANWSGTDSFSYTITDNLEGNATAQVTVTVSPVNDAPVLGPLADALATEDSAFTGALVASDEDAGQALSYTKVSGPAWLTVATDGTLGGSPANADVGSNDFTMRVTDASQTYSEATLHITVANTNDAPVFIAAPIGGPGGNENQAYNASIASSATDIDSGDSLTYSKVSGPAWLSVGEDGSLFGVPGSGDTGANVFIVRVTDEAEAFAETTLHVSVATLGDNGVWTNISGGSWNTGTNWSGGTIASGANRSANFSTLNLTANATVTLNGTRTLGSLTFGDTTPSHTWTLATGSSGPLRLETSSDSPVITVTNSSATLAVVIAGSQGLTKAGGGTLILSGANTYSGPTTANAGTLSLGNRVLHDTSTVTIASGAVLNLNFSGTDQIGALVIGGSPLPAGTYSSKTHPGILTGSGRLKVGTIAAVLPPDLDSDQDGLLDQIEFVLGTDPHSPNGSGVTAQKTGDQIVVTFSRDDVSEEAGLLLTVEAGPTLNSWPQVFHIGDSTATSSPGVTVEENGDAPDSVTVTIPATGSTEFFARVKVLAGG